MSLMLCLLMVLSVFAQGGKSGDYTFAQGDNPKGFENTFIYSNVDGIRLNEMVQTMTGFKKLNPTRFQNCEDNCRIDLEEVGNQTRIRLNRRAKFLGVFNVAVQDTILIDENDAVVEETGNVWRFMQRLRLVKVTVQE